VYLNETAWQERGERLPIGGGLRECLGFSGSRGRTARWRLVRMTLLTVFAALTTRPAVAWLRSRGPRRSDPHAVLLRLSRTGRRCARLDLGVAVTERMLTSWCAGRGVVVPDSAATWTAPHIADASATTNPARYLERYGTRLVDGLKLESVTLAECWTISTGVRVPPRRRRHRARTLRNVGVAAATLAWVCRRLANGREQVGWIRSEAFAQLRLCALEIGKRAATAGRIASARDVFLLTLDELLEIDDMSDGRLTRTVAERMASLDAARRRPAPPGRFATVGVRATTGATAPPAEAIAAPASGEVRGIGGAPGRGCGRVLHVDPTQRPRDVRGRIVVCERLSPELVVLLAGAEGLVVEHGSPLAHAVIIARELGLPTVVAATGAMRLLATDDVVELDATSGVVRAVAST
jgi:phosphohistidine swiveling domain-containing protein